ncbi:MAG: M48 family metallopeptidase [bacterium]
MWQLIRANKRKALFFVFLMGTLLVGVGFSVIELYMPQHGVYGIPVALVIWLVLFLIAYWGGDKIVMSMAGARKIKKIDHARLFNVVEEMQIASGLKHMPDIYVIDTHALNAFATGLKPHKCAIAVTTGLLESLNRDELQGVIAHEMAHIINRDILYMTVVCVMMGSIIILRDFVFSPFRHARTRTGFGGMSRSRSNRSSGGNPALVIFIIIFLILAPLIAQLIYFAISRKREYLADACGVQFTRNPLGLANALAKIGGNIKPLKVGNSAIKPFFIANPEATSLSSLTSTHPPLNKRIAILQNMAGLGYKNYEQSFQKITGTKSSLLPKAAINTAPPEPLPSLPQTQAIPQAVKTAIPAPLMAAIAQTAVTQAPKASSPEPTKLEKHREVTNMMWKLDGLTEIKCSCNTTMRLPPEYLGQEITCPHCSQKHRNSPLKY